MYKSALPGHIALVGAGHRGAGMRGKELLAGPI